MSKTASNNRAIMLAVTTALASTALAGCTTTVAAPAELSASKAQTALAKGKTSQAVEHAEATVLADPRNPGYRAMLGAVYMEVGRFQSAARSFKDAMELGDSSGRTALSYALAEIAAGQQAAALSALNANRNAIDPSDFGLALALAGQPEQGVHVLGNALRGGMNTAKVRQNLAYSYALMGNWRAARLMAAEDVPADQLGDRMGEWAMTAAPESYHQRVANLLNVPVVGDSGQPAMLALSNHSSVEQLAASALAPATPAPGAELPAVASASSAPSYELAPLDAAPQSARLAANVDIPVAQPQGFEQAFSAGNGAVPAAASTGSNKAAFVSGPVAQQAAKPGRVASAEPAGFVKQPAAKSAGIAANGDHLIQLGAFSSQASAERAWTIYVKRYPDLANYQMMITQAKVRGKLYYRVSAGGFQRASAKSMCSTVKADNQGCFAWADGNPLPGALDRSIRMASR